VFLADSAAADVQRARPRCIRRLVLRDQRPLILGDWQRFEYGELVGSDLDMSGHRVTERCTLLDIRLNDRVQDVALRTHGAVLGLGQRLVAGQVVVGHLIEVGLDARYRPQATAAHEREDEANNSE